MQIESPAAGGAVPVVASLSAGLTSPDTWQVPRLNKLRRLYVGVFDWLYYWPEEIAVRCWYFVTRPPVLGALLGVSLFIVVSVIGEDEVELWFEAHVSRTVVLIFMYVVFGLIWLGSVATLIFATRASSRRRRAIRQGARTTAQTVAQLDDLPAGDVPVAGEVRLAFVLPDGRPVVATALISTSAYYYDGGYFDGDKLEIAYDPTRFDARSYDEALPPPVEILDRGRGNALSSAGPIIGLWLYPASMLLITSAFFVFIIFGPE
jgi:hypothetical protein